MMGEHEDALAKAFDGQAERFERAPVQSDPAALARLVAFAALREGSRLLDAGCGPGLVSEAFLDSNDVVGIDLSAEMIARARRRCARFGKHGRFEQISVYDAAPGALFDAAVTRYVVHHMVNPRAFIGRLVELIRPGGVLVVNDHATDPDPELAAHHEQLERLRDTTHTRNLTSGGLVDLLGGAGLVDLRMEEEAFTLDFDEWFDRGTSALSKAEVRARLLKGPALRGFRAQLLPDDSVRIDCVRALVRGVKKSG